MRKPKAGFNNGVDHERGIDGNEELFETGALKCGDGNHIAAVGEVGELVGWDKIYLIKYLNYGLGHGSKLGQDLFNLSLLLFSIRTSGVLDVEKNFGSLDLFEGGAEARNECMGKIADETDGIGEQDLASGRELQLPEFGIESREHAGRFEYTSLGESVKEELLPALV